MDIVCAIAYVTIGLVVCYLLSTNQLAMQDLAHNEDLNLDANWDERVANNGPYFETWQMQLSAQFLQNQ